MSKKIGIYCITNRLNNKSYIGSSTNIPQRLKQHLGELRNGHHRNSHLQNAFNLYGETVFEFGTVEYIDNISDLIPREQYWIDNIGPDRLYNICLIADIPPSWKGKTISPEARMKISLANKGKTRTPEQRRLNGLLHKGKVSPKKKEIYQLDPITGKILATFPSAKEAALAVGLKSKVNINSACQLGTREAAGYRWRYADDENTILKPQNPNTKPKPVEQIDLDSGKIIAIFPSIIEAARAVGLKNRSGVSRICRGIGKMAGGYYWRYAK